MFETFDALDALDMVYAYADAARGPVKMGRPAAQYNGPRTLPSEWELARMSKSERKALVRQKLEGFTERQKLRDQQHAAERQKLRDQQHAAERPGMREYGKFYRALGK